MTLDELDTLTNPAIAQEEEDKRSRSSFRPPFTKLTCDIGELVGPYETTGQFPAKVVAVQLRNIRNVQASTPMADTQWDLEVRVPARANIHSEAVLMVASAATHDASITSIRGLAGRKGVTLEEQVHHYKGRQQEPRDSGNWVDADLTTRFYAVTSIGAGANGAKPAMPTFTDAELDEAAQKVIGLDSAAAVAVLGPDLMGKLLTASVKRVHQQEGIYLEGAPSK